MRERRSGSCRTGERRDRPAHFLHFEWLQRRSANLMKSVVVTKDSGRQTDIEDGFQNLETIQKNLSNDKWPK
jgi:hypothetical protein